jgi:Transposase DDE domain
MNYSSFFEDFRVIKNYPVYPQIFNHLKPFIVKELDNILIKRKKKQTGRPIKTDLSKVIDAVFFLANTGGQSIYIEQYFGIKKSTFYKYFKIIKENQILQNFYNHIIQDYPISEPLITDTFTVKSMDGSAGLGKNPTDRRRKGLKVSIICDSQRVATKTHIAPANDHDRKVLGEMVKEKVSYEIPVKCLGDSGYVGKKLRKECAEHGLRLVAQPRRTSKEGFPTHIILKTDKYLLKQRRNQIELLNGQIRRFRGLMLKWTKTISAYECFLYVALLCITCYELYKKVNENVGINKQKKQTRC